jgi:hypothetical protein
MVLGASSHRRPQAQENCSRSAKLGETIAKPTAKHNKNVLFILL